VEGELDRVVAVGVDGLHLDHGARARLDDGDGGHLPGVRVEDLRHAHLSAQDPFHTMPFIARA
jgi:hypothetical protein